LEKWVGRPLRVNRSICFGPGRAAERESLPGWLVSVRYNQIMRAKLTGTFDVNQCGPGADEVIE
jgi:hypothetical protein